MKGRDILVKLYLKYRDWDEIYKAILVKEDITHEPIVHDRSKTYITILDKRYPEEFKKIYKPLFVLECSKKVPKNLDTLRSKYIYVIGEQTITFTKFKKCFVTSELIEGRLTYIVNFEDSDFKVYTNSNREAFSVASYFSKSTVIHDINEEDFHTYFSYHPGACERWYVVPTILPSINNRLIKMGANLYDTEDEL